MRHSIPVPLDSRQPPGFAFVLTVLAGSAPCCSAQPPKVLDQPAIVISYLALDGAVGERDRPQAARRKNISIWKSPTSPVCDRMSRDHSGYVFVADYIDADRVVYRWP